MAFTARAVIFHAKELRESASLRKYLSKVTALHTWKHKKGYSEGIRKVIKKATASYSKSNENSHD